ncbi:MAG: sulfatase-like hydrolase/transferase [Bacteroidales bacterium]|nr:sulfatase-like hydrolase/transferase [Bacteroidales bacterium]
MKKELALVGLAATALAIPGKALAQQKPNIVLILADDLGWGDISCHNGYVQTPNIDRIFNQGIEMDRFYAAPVSSPTRCGVMTGRYPSRFGIRETVIPPWRDYGLPLEEETMADMLGRNGYSNRAAIGKWHLGHSRKAYYPLNRGFTHFHGALNGAFEYFDHTRDGQLDWHDDWESCYEEGYTTDLIADEAAKCIREYSKEGPFFVYTCFNAPHSPYEAPEDEIASLIPLDEFAKLKKKDRNGWTYRAMVSRMDKGVGRILEAIEESGQADNTIVLFMSDNGGVPDFEPYCNNRPFRGSKFNEFEGGVRVCAAIYWKDGFRNGRKIDQVTGFVDLLPTLKDIVGDKSAPKNPYDGISVYSVLSGKKKLIKRDFYLGVGAAVNHKYKYIIAGRNEGMKLKEDMFNDIVANPYEENGKARAINDKARKHLRQVALDGDAIVPYQKEIPYGFGKDGFVPPFEWKPVKD